MNNQILKALLLLLAVSSCGRSPQQVSSLEDLLVSIQTAPVNNSWSFEINMSEIYGDRGDLWLTEGAAGVGADGCTFVYSRSDNLKHGFYSSDIMLASKNRYMKMSGMLNEDGSVRNTTDDQWFPSKKPMPSLFWPSDLTGLNSQAEFILKNISPDEVIFRDGFAMVSADISVDEDSAFGAFNTSCPNSFQGACHLTMTYDLQKKVMTEFKLSQGENHYEVIYPAAETVEVKGCNDFIHLIPWHLSAERQLATDFFSGNK